MFDDVTSFVKMFVEQALQSESTGARERIPKCSSLLRVVLIVFRTKYRFADPKLMGSHGPFVEWSESHKLVEILEIMDVDFVGTDTDNGT